MQNSREIYPSFIIIEFVQKVRDECLHSTVCRKKKTKTHKSENTMVKMEARKRILERKYLLVVISLDDYLSQHISEKPIKKPVQ